MSALHPYLTIKDGAVAVHDFARPKLVYVCTGKQVVYQALRWCGRLPMHYWFAASAEGALAQVSGANPEWNRHLFDIRDLDRTITGGIDPGDWSSTIWGAVPLDDDFALRLAGIAERKQFKAWLRKAMKRQTTLDLCAVTWAKIDGSPLKAGMTEGGKA